MTAQAALDVLIAAAHRVELTALSALVAAARSAERGGVRFALAEVGVGMTAAGAGMMAALCRTPARAVVLVGSFGAYAGRGASIGELLLPDELVLIDGATLVGHAALPAPMPARAPTDRALREGLRSCAPFAGAGALGTTLSITTDDALARSLGEGSGCVGENLEGVCVAAACAAAGVPFAALLGCTNVVGAHGRAQWLAEHERLARRTCGVILQWLDRGAPGRPGPEPA